MSELDDILGAYRVPRVSVTITLRGDLNEEITRLAEQYKSLPVNPEALNAEAVATELQDQMTALADEMWASRREFVFEGLSGGTLDRLRAACPPVPSEAKKGATVDGAMFERALIAASSVEPKMTEQDVQRLIDTLTPGDMDLIRQTVKALMEGDNTPPKFVTRSRPEDLDETSSATAPSTESDAQSS